MGDESEPRCASCRKPERSNAHLHQCSNCSKLFHSQCVKLATVSIKGKPGKACTPRIMQTKPQTPTLSTSSTSSVHSETKETETEIQMQKPSESKSTDTLLQDILDQMKIMEIASTQRFDVIDDKLKELDKIPELVRRVESAEADLAGVRLDIKTIQERLDKATDDEECKKMQRDIDSLQQQVNQLSLTKPTADATSLSKEASLLRKEFLALERRNAELSASLNKSVHESTTADLVIGSLTVPKDADIKTLITAVLSTIYPDFDRRDLVSARVLLSKNYVRISVAQADDATTANSSGDHGGQSNQTSNQTNIAATKSPLQNADKSSLAQGSLAKWFSSTPHQDQSSLQSFINRNHESKD